MREEFHAARRTGLGGSDIAAIMGLDPYRGPADVYDEKMGVRPVEPPSKAAQRGIALEEVIRRRYEEETGRRVRRQPRLRRHPRDRWLIAHVDGLIDGEPKGVLEVKAPGLQRFATIKREGLPAAWVLQLQHYLLTLDLSWGSYAVLNAEAWRFVHFDVERDAELCAEIADRAAAFWVDHIKARVRPEVEAAPPAAAIPIKAGEAVKRDDPEWAEAVAMLVEARDTKKTAELLEQYAREKVRETMGAAEIVQGAGYVVTYKEQPGRRNVKLEELVAAAPLDPFAVQGLLAERALMTLKEITEITPRLRLNLENYVTQARPFRSFRIYPLKAEREE